jgi:hypothetical protein
MKHHPTRSRLGGLLLAVTAALAMLALPGLASSHEDADHNPPGDAGTIASFDPNTGLLVVDLAEGDTASGLVVERTQIRCGKPPRKHRRGHGGDSASERPGPGEGRPPKGEGPPPPPNDQGEDSDGPGSGPSGQGEDGNDDPPGQDGTDPGASEGPGEGAEHGRRPPRCDEDDLVPGTVVKKAEIVLTDGNAYFRVICLPRPEKAPEEPAAEVPSEG